MLLQKTIYYCNTIIIGCIALLGPCSEALPPFTDPSNILSGTMGAFYVLSPTANGMSARFTVVNTYEETLDDVVDISGRIVIQSLRNPDVTRTLSLTALNIIYARNFNSTTRRLVLDPKDSLVFLVSWNFTSDDRGVNLRNVFFRYVKDPVCEDLRCLALQEDFSLTGEVTIFNRVEEVKASILFPLCYVSNYVEPRFCLSITTSPPCLEPPSLINGFCSPSTAGGQ